MYSISNIDKILEQFESSLKNRALSTNTLRSYRTDILQYCEYLAHNHNNISFISDDYVVNLTTFLSKLHQNGMSNATISRKFAAIKCLYLYLSKLVDTVDYETISQIKLPKVERSLPKILSTNEVKLLLEQPNCVNPKGYRDKAMLELLYATGIRVSELICLNVSSLDLDSGTITCSNEHRQRVVPLNSSAVSAIKDYLKKSRYLLIQNKNEVSLFVNKNGKRLTRQGFWKIVKQYEEKIGSDITITPHTVRHSLGVHLFNSGANLKYIQKVLGHSDISSTSIYAQMANSVVTNSLSKENSDMYKVIKTGPKVKKISNKPPSASAQ